MEDCIVQCQRFGGEVQKIDVNDPPAPVLASDRPAPVLAPRRPTAGESFDGGESEVTAPHVRAPRLSVENRWDARADGRARACSKSQRHR